MTVDLLREGREPLPACWADLSVSGVMLILPGDSVGSLQRGDSILLGFTVDGISLQQKGTIVWSLPDDTGKIVKAGVHFAEMNSKVSDLHPRLWEYFNRRESFRAGSAEAESPDVTLTHAGRECTGRMLDISTSGISLIFDAMVADDAQLESQLGLEYLLELKLTSDLPTISLRSRAERFEREGRYVMMAFSFPEQYDVEAEEQRAVVAEYVALREKSLRDDA